LDQSRDFLEDSVHADIGIDGGIDFMMVRAGMHHQHLRSRMSFLDHVRQVMAIVLRKSGAKDDQIESALPQGLLNALAIEGGSHVMSGFGHLGGLARERLFIGLAVKNFDGCAMSRLLSGCGQRTLLELTRSLASGEHASEVTEDQGQMAPRAATGQTRLFSGDYCASN